MADYQNGDELDQDPEIKGEMFGVDLNPTRTDRKDDLNSVQIQLSMDDDGFVFIESFDASWLGDLIDTLTRTKKLLDSDKRFKKDGEQYLFK